MTTTQTNAQASLQALLTRLWEEVLETPVKADDNFFMLGGNSIKAVRVMNRLQEEMHAIFHPASLFDAPTVEQLTRYCITHYPAVFDASQPDIGNESVTDAQTAAAREHLLYRGAARDLQVDTAEPDNRPAIFILSPPRSGSTLLRVILAGSKELFSPPELYLLSFNTLQQRREQFSGKLEFFREGLLRALMELKPCSHTEAANLMREYENQGMSTKAFFGLMQEWARQRRIVDKTPGYAFNPTILQRAEAEFDNALFIHLVRHPMATVSSFEEIRADLVTGNPADELPFTPRQKGELWWQISHQNILSFLQTVPAGRQFQLRYEDLVTAPENNIRRLCDFLDITFSSEMLNPYQEKQQRMTDGVTAVSKIMGDQKFHTYTGIDASGADRWRDKYREDFLCETSWVLAESLGYERASFAADDEEREEWEI
ncbi:sulfotransferase family protein [Thiothrix nivea]|uniref:Phosphopantetheine-binding protein n=1 Tax=Thiothrix nivea (strain ATCC 35100 / DSM 5205 / JP2) TaxID=870187 RepID=A0A656HKU9_THINJ|nr:sulfotransferase [Thiothrix nivea]EIJ36862.1 phosphopantetheine-binding protein [Thiothrix nivea DSM 5205]